MAGLIRFGIISKGAARLSIALYKKSPVLKFLSKLELPRGVEMRILHAAWEYNSKQMGGFAPIKRRQVFSRVVTKTEILVPKL